MNSTEANWQSHHQNELQAHSILSQLAALVFPDGQFISRLQFPTPDVAFQLWSHDKKRSVILLCSKVIDQNFILDLLQALTAFKVSSGHADDALSLVDVHLFGLKFQDSFTSKLNFLKINCRLYCVSISRNQERDIVLVRDFQAKATEVAPPPYSAPPINEPEVALPKVNPLSTQELSEFVQFGMDLRKLRESN